MGPVGELSTDKTKKYDRQLRLWGDHGQISLEAAKVCLINATATGTEILKNLILPGIGSFTILDNKIITEEDLGNNFFYDVESIGQKRSKVAKDLLLELNDDVSGDILDEDVNDLLKKSPEIFCKYNVVIALSLPKRTLLALAELLWSHDIPLVVCKSYGMLGYLRIVTKEHTVIESHPEHPYPDLRLDNPFKQLQEFCDSINLESLDKKDHSHTPWLVLMYKYLEVYKQQNGGEIPKTYKQKQQLKELIRQGIRLNVVGVPEDEENFDEAMRSVNTALTITSIPDNIQKIIARCPIITGESKAFWVMVSALKDFITSEDCLPLRGTIPDMTSDSERYISLQKIYRNKANDHVQNMLVQVHAIKEAANMSEPVVVKSSTPEPSEIVTEDDVRLFCKNAAYLNVTDCRSLADEYAVATMNCNLIASHLDEDSGADDSVYYVLLRAADEFYTEYSRYPGSYDDQVEADVSLLKIIVNKLLQEWGLTTVSVREDNVHEFCCYGASEIHSVAAYMGGVASQEIIKLVTKQYIPIKNTYIYNATTQTSVTLDC